MKTAALLSRVGFETHEKEEPQRLLSSRPDDANSTTTYCLMTINHEARMGPCGPRPGPPPAAGGGGAAPGAGGGTGPRSGWKRYTLCVAGSTVIVFAPAKVGTVATVVYLSGESWCTTVTLPSPPFGM